MAVELTLTQLVRNGTMSPEMADTLMVAARSRSSLLFFAGPRLAGKTTTLRATLAYVPDGTPVHEVSADEPELGIPAQPDGGYLLVHEFAETPVFPTYIWGEPVRRVFDALATGALSLAAATHADSLGGGLRQDRGERRAGRAGPADRLRRPHPQPRRLA